MIDGTDGGETPLKWVVDEPHVEDRMGVEERLCGEDLDCYKHIIIIKAN